MASDKFSNLFALSAEGYVRDVNVVQHSIEYMSQFLAKARGIPVEEAKEFVLTGLRPGGAFQFKDPKVTYLERQSNGDREKKETRLSHYLGTSLKKNELIAPTFTTYVNPAETESILSAYVKDNIRLRSVAKKAMFRAKAVGDKPLMEVKKIEQTGRKLSNNAISGAHVSASTPMYNKTAHSTLTSTCRTTSGYGNANNEKFLSGNRHYFNYHIVLNNIVTITNNVDYAKIEAVMQICGLHYPTVDQVMRVIEHSAGLYWWDTRHTKIIRDYVEKLDDLQRAAFVYVGDAFWLMQYNKEFMFDFLTALSNKVEGVHSDPDSILKQASDGYINLAHQICFEETKGIAPHDYGTIKDKPAYHTLALTIENIADTVLRYSDLIQAFWMTPNLPASVAHFPNSVRRSALTSDTDSTIFTVQDWVIWYTGRPGFDSRSRSVYAAVVFLASATITHVLATMSVNFGIVKENLFKIEMKSEYSFDVFIPTQLGKHYFACMSCQEGNVFKEMNWEIKGAQLKSANAPRHVIEAATAMMKKIINTVLAEEKISLAEHLTNVADQERSIIESIRKGELHYLRGSSIKDIASYAGEPQDSPYANHFFWQEVWGEKYGFMPNPPYQTKKVSVTLDTPTKLKAWVASIEDKDLQARLVKYLEKTNKKNITTFHLPVDVIASRGIPPEIERVIDYERIVLDICRIFYIILECLGYYGLGDRVKKLVSNNGW